MSNKSVNQEMKEYKAIKQAVKQCRQAKNIGKKETMSQADFFNVAFTFSPIAPKVSGRNWIEADWKNHHANYAKSIRAKIEALPANASAEDIEAVIVGCVLASVNLTHQIVRNYLSRKRYVVKAKQPHDLSSVEAFEAEQMQSLIGYLKACDQYGDDFMRAFIAEELVTSPVELAGLW